MCAGAYFMDISLLAQQLEQEDPEQYELQKAALTLLVDSPNEDATKVFVKVAQDFQDSTLINVAINGLAKIGSDEAIDALAKMVFEHSNTTIRSEAARALGYSRNAMALPPLKRLLAEGLESEETMPIAEALWALANLCQAEVFKPDPEWESLIEQWKKRGGEYSIMARHIRICWDGQIVIS
jgi:HEAT repeat protein